MAVDLGTLRARLMMDTTSLKKADVAVSSFSRNAIRSFKSVGAAAVVLAGIYGLVKLQKSVVTTGAKFEQSMLTVKGVMRATSAEFASLSAAAKKMGAETEWTASQAANSLQFLGMAGFNAVDAVKALPGTLDLATAGQIELGRAADIASNALTAMQLPVEQLSRVNDVFVGTITRTNTNMEMMAESFKYAAPLAQSYGYTIERLSAMIGMLGNAGIQGSMAGTQLAMAMTKARGIAKELKLDSADLVHVLQTLTKRGWSVDKVFDAFGLRGGRAALVLKNLADQVNGLNVQLDNAEGEAKTLADIMRSSLIGSWKELKSAIESVAIEAFERYKEGLKDSVISFIQLVRNNKEELVNALVSIGRATMFIADQIARAARNLAKFVNFISGASKGLAENVFGPTDVITRMREEIKKTAAELKEMQSSATSGMMAFDLTENIQHLKDKLRVQKIALQRELKSTEVKRKPLKVSFPYAEGMGELSKPPIADEGALEEAKKKAEEYQKMMDKVRDNAYMKEMEHFERIQEMQQKVYTDIEDKKKEHEDMMTKLSQDALLKELDSYQQAGEAQQEVYDKMAEAEKERAEKMLEIAQEKQKKLEDILRSGAESFSDILEVIKSDSETKWAKIAEIAINYAAQIAKAVSSINQQTNEAKGVEGGTDWWGIAGSVLNVVGGLSFAKGGAFSSGKLTAFAGGGVLGGPTIFPFADGIGLAGEAGDEGILPLTRTPGGDLGVKSVGGGESGRGGVFYNNSIYAMDPESFADFCDRNPGAVTGLVVKNMSEGGDISKAMKEVMG